MSWPALPHLGPVHTEYHLLHQWSNFPPEIIHIVVKNLNLSDTANITITGNTTVILIYGGS